jgi:hypothetical protein
MTHTFFIIDDAFIILFTLFSFKYLNDRIYFILLLNLIFKEYLNKNKENFEIKLK